MQINYYKPLKIGRNRELCLNKVNSMTLMPKTLEKKAINKVFKSHLLQREEMIHFKIKNNKWNKKKNWISSMSCKQFWEEIREVKMSKVNKINNLVLNLSSIHNSQRTNNRKDYSRILWIILNFLWMWMELNNLFKGLEKMFRRII